MWKRKKRELENRQAHAEEAIAISLRDYHAMQMLKKKAERIEKGNRKIQQENKFSLWLFGENAA